MTTITPEPMQRSRGMRDLLPADMRAFRQVEDAFRAAASRWGYDEIRTPTLETYSLFTAAGALTPEMLSRVYSFLDWDGWSGERVVLRPDSTIPVTRAAFEGGIEPPARLSYIQNVFRFAETGDREDWQCGIEFLGAPPVIGDLEAISLACETFDALGLRPEIRLSHVGIVRAMANGNANGAIAQREAFFTAAATTGGISLLTNLRALAGPAIPGALEPLTELEAIARALAASGRDVMVDLSLPRDFEYYSGVVFEFRSDGEAWGAGGRYTPSGSTTAPTACGLALEASRIALHLVSRTRKRLVVSIVPGTPADFGTAVSCARALHRSGVAASLAADAAQAEIAVTISDGRLLARTPGGEREMTALDDVVGLLIQFK